jgi:hypothetical protein
MAMLIFLCLDLPQNLYRLARHLNVDMTLVVRCIGLSKFNGQVSPKSFYDLHYGFELWF